MTRSTQEKVSATQSSRPKFVARPPAPANGRRRLGRLLIANRGEIACRIISTCKVLNIASIAIYTDEDRDSLHVQAADEAICLGSIQGPKGNPHQNSKLIIEIALSNKADAIHPGYGYLSENAGFAKQVQEAGLMFVGPSPYAISVLGDKRQAKEFLWREAPQVPTVPGYHGAAQDVKTLESAAQEIGFPVMIKAAAGGGGRGMRIVQDKASFREQLSSAQSEARSSFGSSDCILEKYIEHGKHVEVQIVGDSSGNVISLGARDCSVQRRHQKIIEEAPSAWLAHFPNVREEMTEAAVAVGKLLRYESAGTVEFMVDVKTKKFYFLEINTRIQVEHAITEEITSIDIVALQLFIAAGGVISDCRELSILTQHGHAIECRLCAEDPAREFMPDSGLILRWTSGSELLDSQQREGVRIETAITTGSNVSVYFDSMIAKIIVWAIDRASAIEKMKKVLRHTICEGIKTNHLFLQACLQHQAFNRVDYSTSFIPTHINELLSNPYEEDMSYWYERFCFAPSLFTRWIGGTREQSTYQPFGTIRPGFRNQVHDKSNRLADVVLIQDSGAPRKSSSGFYVTWSVRRGAPKGTYFYRRQPLALPAIATSDQESKSDPGTALASHFNGTLMPLQLQRESSTDYNKVRIVESTCLHHHALDSSNREWVSASIIIEHADQRQTLHLTTSPTFFARDAAASQRIFVHLPSLGTSLDYSRFTLLSYGEAQRSQFQGDQQVDELRVYKSVMPCKVLRLLKGKGDKVRKGEAMLIVESMKTEVKIVASLDGKFEPKVKEGDAVGDDVLLCELVDVES